MEVELSEGMKKNLAMVLICIGLLTATVAAKNISVPEDSTRVGYTEVYTECIGLEAGVCIGVEQRDSTTYNYNDYESPEPGTENFYRMVESELMLRAYNTCDSSMSGMEWTDEVSFRNRTAAEWMDNENVTLLPCEKSFYRKLNATE